MFFIGSNDLMGDVHIESVVTSDFFYQLTSLVYELLVSVARRTARVLLFPGEMIMSGSEEQFVRKFRFFIFLCDLNGH